MTHSLEAFADLIPMEEVDFSLHHQQQFSVAGSGQIHAADRAPAQWRARIVSMAIPHDEAHGIMAALYSLHGSMGTFYLTVPQRAFPASDPDGSIFGSATPEVGTITDRVTVAFTGFPAGYQLRRGDYFQVNYGSGGTRRYLGQFVEDGTADGGGAVASVKVAPPLPNMIATGAAVTVIRPACKFRIAPNSVRISQVGPLHARIELAAWQTV